jgi:hypothetical protein
VKVALRARGRTLRGIDRYPLAVEQRTREGTQEARAAASTRDDEHIKATLLRSVRGLSN